MSDEISVDNGNSEINPTYSIRDQEEFKMYLIANQSKYDRMYSLFLEKSKLHESHTETLQYHLPMALRRLNTLSIKSQPFRVLGVGSGMGQMDLEILKIIRTEYYKETTSGKVEIFNRVVEPNKYHLRRYKESVAHLPDPLGNEAKITFDFERITFQKYALELQQFHGNKFDMVHFIHSIHCVHVQSALLHCYNEVLEDQGVIVCIVGNRESIIHSINIKLKEMDRQKRISDLISGNDVTDAVCHEKWVFGQHKYEYEIDITEIFKENSIEGDLLLDFLTQTLNFRSEANKEMVSKMVGFLKDHSEKKEDGTIMARGVNDCIIIFKGC